MELYFIMPIMKRYEEFVTKINHHFEFTLFQILSNIPSIMK